MSVTFEREPGDLASHILLLHYSAYRLRGWLVQQPSGSRSPEVTMELANAILQLSWRASKPSPRGVGARGLAAASWCPADPAARHTQTAIIKGQSCGSTTAFVDPPPLWKTDLAY